MSTHKLTQLALESGPDRFFVVKHDPKTKTKPVRIELRQGKVGSRKIESLSILLGYDNSVADPNEVYETAKLIEARVGRIDEVTGVYA